MESKYVTFLVILTIMNIAFSTTNIAADCVAKCLADCKGNPKFQDCILDCIGDYCLFPPSPKDGGQRLSNVDVCRI
ncbi:hypothetical protein CASFOL_026007 [Castilleja foliolosa]|uniref:Uncharacterized protein n=1 Tax=Castilleja foliolosa TaxID=1961234 RepID=A0ABD3CSQ4_9LAMI